MSFGPKRRRRHARCLSCQGQQSPQTVSTGGNACPSRLPQPRVQVPGARLAKCCSEWLAVQPTTWAPSWIWGIPGTCSDTRVIRAASGTSRCSRRAGSGPIRSSSPTWTATVGQTSLRRRNGETTVSFGLPQGGPLVDVETAQTVKPNAQGVYQVTLKERRLRVFHAGPGA